MKMIFRIMLCGLMLAAASARAADPDKPETDASIQLANIGIPVFTGHTVSNYLFVSIKIHLTPHAPEEKFRDMEPYFRDAAVRSSSKTCFADPKRSDKLDIPRFKVAMMAAFAKVTGPGMIKSIEIVDQNAEHPAH